MNYPKCSIGKDESNLRDNPRNREAATAIQLHDTAVVLWQCAHAETSTSFARQLEVLKTQIKQYEFGEALESARSKKEG
jgi:hypothetical protein